MNVCSGEAMVHFLSWSYGNMMYDQLLWKTTDHDVIIIIITLSELGRKKKDVTVPFMNRASLK